MIRARWYLNKRNSYAYPAVALTKTSTTFRTLFFQNLKQMERHFSECLLSRSNARVTLGYLGIVYWGHYSDSKAVVRHKRAMQKVRLAKDALRQRRITDSAVAKAIRAASACLHRGMCGEAISELMPLPQLGFAFASKVCAFLSPERCGVIDSIIATNHKRFRFATYGCGSRRYVAARKINSTRYQQYCRFLQQKAAWLNGKGSALKWQDSDGKRYPWRAVDVERALYVVK